MTEPRKSWRSKSQDARPKRTPAHPKSAVPFRAVTMLLYGRYDWLTRLGNRRYTCAKSEMAKELKVPAYRLVQYLGYLQDWGLLEKLSVSRHSVALVLREPVQDNEEKW